MRKLIAAMKTSVDGKIEGADGYADWVDAWSEDYGLTSQIDACLLGGQMYVGYELYWTAIQQSEPGEPLPMTGSPPSAAEVAWARFAAETPHYVLSNTQTSSAWPNTTFIRGLEDIAALKQAAGQGHLPDGWRSHHGHAHRCRARRRAPTHRLSADRRSRARSSLRATEGRHALELRTVEQLPSGLLSLIYEIGDSSAES